MLEPKRNIPLPITLASSALLFSSLFFLMWLTDHFQKTCPRTPDEEAGIVFPLDEHGSVVYLTATQHREYIAASVYLGVAVVLFFGVGIWASRPPRGGSELKADS